MPRLDRPKKNEPISFEWGCAVADLINQILSDGPEVCSPLAKFEGGAVYIAQEYQHFLAITTDVIPARGGTSNKKWGSGPAKFLTAQADGTEMDMPGMAAFTAWNWTGGPIASGTRIWVCWSYDRWMAEDADCSGVP